MGEWEVRMVLEGYGEDGTAQRLRREWRGGSYYAAGRKGAKPSDPNSSAHVGLYYISKWSNEAAAREFAKIYAAGFAKRYSGLQHQRPDTTRPGLDNYQSSEGPLFITQSGNMAVTVANFDPSVVARPIEIGLKQGQETAGTVSPGNQR